MWRLFLGGALFFWQNGSGINAINYYSPTVFNAEDSSCEQTSVGTPDTDLEASLALVISARIAMSFGVVKTVVTFIWLLWLIDHVGRRNLLLIGAAGGSSLRYHRRSSCHSCYFRVGRS
jgi:MFS family permease